MRPPGPALIVVALAVALALGNAGIISAYPPDVAYQPDSPLQITRCAVKLTISRSGDQKTIRYLEQMFVRNRSKTPIASVDFSVIGSEGDNPVASELVTTKWRVPIKPKTTSDMLYRAAGTINRFSQSTPWDDVNKFRCAVLRVHFTNHKVWKDVAVIQLATDASPDQCVVDLPDGGASASSCADDSRMSPADVTTFENITNPRIADVRRAAARTLARDAGTRCNHSAAVVGDAVQPNVPEDAAGATGTAIVRVTLNEAGAVTATTIAKSTGNDALDNAASDAAGASRYTPAVANCKPVSSSFGFQADFTK